MAASATLFNQAYKMRQGTAFAVGVAAEVTLLILSLLVLIGLWTPVTGVLIAVAELWIIFSKSVFLRTGDFGGVILLPALGAALALLGPGGWSLDARLFGWKRIKIRD